jgi:hypothetical protein
MKLTNGATVLRASITYDREGFGPCAVVLAKWGDFEFVTWDAYPVKGDSDSWDCEVGHYFAIREPIFTVANVDAAYDLALADYRTRAAHR